MKLLCDGVSNLEHEVRLFAAKIAERYPHEHQQVLHGVQQVRPGNPERILFAEEAGDDAHKAGVMGAADAFGFFASDPDLQTHEQTFRPQMTKAPEVSQGRFAGNRLPMLGGCPSADGLSTP